MCDQLTVVIDGEDTVKQWFGGWPCFHDAEVINLFLSRAGESVLRVYPYYPQKPATVEFVFTDVSDVELNDFSGQNVISSLAIGKATGQYGEDVYRLTLSPCYGIAGRIDAKSMRVQLLPGASADGISQW